MDAPLRHPILATLSGLRAHGVGVVLVTHDLAGAHLVCDEIAVLDAGRIVERGPLVGVLDHPAHPATRRLLDAVGSL